MHASFAGPSCPKGMTSLYGKCVGIVKNSESNTGNQDNCKWKSGSSSFELAKFGNVKVILNKLEKLPFDKFLWNRENINFLLTK